MYNLFTKAHKGPQQPTQAHEDEKEPKRRQTRLWAIGACFFKMYYLFFIFLLLQAPAAHLWPGRCPQKPTKAHISQRRPMQAHKDEKGPKQCQMRRLGHRYVFLMYNLFLIFLTNWHAGP